jgi:hypothetical protein
MSTEFRIRTIPVVRRAVIDGDVPDLRWYEEAAPDPLADGRWEVFLDRISTRLTTVEWATGTMTVTIRAGACIEDCNLGDPAEAAARLLALVRRVQWPGAGVRSAEDRRAGHQ